MDSFLAIADPTRRRIIEDLADGGQMSASAIAARFAVSKPAISQHLNVLKAAGLVEMEIRAQFRLYRLKPEAMDEMAQWIMTTRRMWSNGLQRLETLLKEEDDGTRTGTAGQAAGKRHDHF